MSSDSSDELKEVTEPRLIVSDADKSDSSVEALMPVSIDKNNDPSVLYPHPPIMCVQREAPRLLTIEQIGKFVLFVAGTYAPWFIPHMIAPGHFVNPMLANAHFRTILCALFTWNLIGAALFSRTKLQRADRNVVLAYIISSFVIPFAGIFFLSILMSRSLGFNKETAEVRATVGGQLLLFTIFGMPMLLFPMLGPVVITLLQALGLKLI